MTMEAVCLLCSLCARKAWDIPKVQGKTHHKAICHSKKSGPFPFRVSHHCEGRRESHQHPVTDSAI